MWAGTYGKGLWRIQGEDARLFTVADGLSSNQIRSLYQDPDGTLWIGTFGGGLDALRDGRFQAFTAKDGLLSDNIASLTDDGESLWLSTTRGICRIAKRQLREFAEHKRKTLEPANYGVEDGLRSAQCSPSYPIGGGGNRTSDGRLWFTTGRGLAVLDPRGLKQAGPAPVVHLVEMTADGLPVDLGRAARLAPGSQRIQVRYTAIHLSAPERVQYSYKLEGLDAEWVSGRRPAGDRLQQPAARPLPVYRESQSARRAGQRRIVLLRIAAAVLRDGMVPSAVRGAGAGLRVGGVPAACAADPLPVRAGAGGAGQAGARDPRHAGAGIRGHFFATRRRGHVPAGRDGAGAQVPGDGAAAWRGTA